MKKFSFSLEQVLQYKNQVLANLQQEHAAVIREMTQQQDVIHTLEEQIETCQEEFGQKKQEGVPLPMLCTYESYLEKLYARKEKEESILEIIRKKEDIKRQEVIEARVEVTSFEKLREQRLHQYQYELQKGEEQQIEEFVSHRRVAGAFR